MRVGAFGYFTLPTLMTSRGGKTLQAVKLYMSIEQGGVNLTCRVDLPSHIFVVRLEYFQPPVVVWNMRRRYALFLVSICPAPLVLLHVLAAKFGFHALVI